VTVLLAVVVAALFGLGSWLLMQRRLSRIIIGVGLLGHGANLLLVTSGGPGGRAPIIVGDDAGVTYADPLPQALALTAIVITFGVTAFLLALAYRSWQITRDDLVEDDVEDSFVARLQREASEAPLADPDDTAEFPDGLEWMSAGPDEDDPLPGSVTPDETRGAP
jgi:multicomponent Na+:H+ antiporter subunit C